LPAVLALPFRDEALCGTFSIMGLLICRSISLQCSAAPIGHLHR
jgi:hypothetical protein